jgi:hypothetical protein
MPNAMSPEALRVYRSGTPWLQRYLPFWLANLADRMWVALLAIVAVLIPLSRVLPPLYEFRIRSRVFRWYGQLREADIAADALDEIDRGAGRVSVPLSADELRLAQPLLRRRTRHLWGLTLDRCGHAVGLAQLMRAAERHLPTSCTQPGSRPTETSSAGRRGAARNSTS